MRSVRNVCIFVVSKTTTTMKKDSIKLSDFRFIPSGRGYYKVTYTSPVTGKLWMAITSDMSLIDATKNEDDPKKVDLNHLKRVCKGL